MRRYARPSERLPSTGAGSDSRAAPGRGIALPARPSSPLFAHPTPLAHRPVEHPDAAAEEGLDGGREAGARVGLRGLPALTGADAVADVVLSPRHAPAPAVSLPSLRPVVLGAEQH